MNRVSLKRMRSQRLSVVNEEQEDETVLAWETKIVYSLIPCNFNTVYPCVSSSCFAKDPEEIILPMDDRNPAQPQLNLYKQLSVISYLLHHVISHVLLHANNYYYRKAL